MRGIGEVARASGLAVSALRFYDRAGVLVPAEVDPVTGYRRYSGEQVRAARLIAGLRRVGLPVAEIAEAGRGMGEPEAGCRRAGWGPRRVRGRAARPQAEGFRLQPLACPVGKPDHPD